MEGVPCTVYGKNRNAVFVRIFLWGFLFTVNGTLFTPPVVLAALREEPRDNDKDEKPDEWRIFDGDRLVRIERSRDAKGQPAVVIFFNQVGGKDVPIRSEVDRNHDGTPDLIRFYKEGKPDHEQADLNFDGKPDAWAFYKDGVKDLMIMDKNHDGKPDAWFYYGQGGLKLSGGRVDEDFDGKIDRTFGTVPEKETRRPW